MQEENSKYRNMTLSFKVAAQEKIMLKREVEEKSTTMSEFLYTTVMCFHSEYDYIGRANPKEEKLARELALSEKNNNKLEIKLENADYRVKMEIKRADEAVKAKDECLFQLKVEKVKNVDLSEEIKLLKAEKDALIKENELKDIAIATLQSKINRLKKDTENDNKNNLNTNIVIGGVGVVAGGSLVKFLRG